MLMKSSLVSIALAILQSSQTAECFVINSPSSHLPAYTHSASINTRQYLQKQDTTTKDESEISPSSSSSSSSPLLSSFLSTAREARIESPLNNLVACGCGCVGATAWSFTPQSVLAATPPPSRPMEYYFPTAVPVKTLAKTIGTILPDYKKDNTLVATSICADEVNAPLVEALNKFNRPFNLGGLAGVPFVGLSGLKACLSHVPADGNLLIVIGPHIGFDKNNFIGFVDRVGQDASSTACGAVIGALKLIQAGKTDLGGVASDAQEEWILKELAARVPEDVLTGGDEDGKIAFVTYQMYCMARDYLRDILTKVSKRPREVAVLAGVVINRGETQGDMFQPLMFEKIDQDGMAPRSIFRNCFGEKPYLYPVLYKKRDVVEDVLEDMDVPPLGPKAGKSLRDYFPTAAAVTNIVPLINRHLPHFTKANTLVATSICSDEINFPIVTHLSSHFEQPFNLGGLAGVPFSGVSGMGACMSHVPQDGNLLIVMGSHVGFDSNSYLGKVNRPGQEGSSGACGAAIGALKVIQANKGKSVTPSGFVTDAQEDEILKELGARLPPKVLKSNDMEAKTAFTTYQTYAVARNYLDDVLSRQKSMPKEVAVLAGVIINRGTDGEDMFQPLLFQHMKGGVNRNLYTEAFGGKPYLGLLPVMSGMREAVEDVLGDLKLKA